MPGVANVLGVYANVAVTLLPIFLCTAVGAGWAKRKIVYPGLFVSTLVTMVATPALVFHTLVTTSLSAATVLNVALAAAAGIAVMGGMSWVALRLTGFAPRLLVPAATFPNAGNLGLPLSQLAFGDAGLSVAVTFFAVTSFLQHTVGVTILTAGKGKAAWISPVVIAAVLAVTLRALELPAPGFLLESARMLGALTVPLMLISLGHTLVTISHGSLRDGVLLGAIRLLVGLAGGLLVVWMLPLSGAVAQVVMLQMLMPVAVINYLYAQRYTPYAESTAAAVLVSTLVFLALAPLVLWYVGAPIGAPVLR